MKKYLRHILISLIASVGCITTYAFQFSNVFSFGDSLSDIGNHSPQSPWTNNHGDLWTKIISGRFGIDQGASSNGGSNYAIYGDQTGYAPGNFNNDNGVLGTQLPRFFSNNPNVDPKALYTIWAGANDIFQQTSTLLLPFVSQCTIDPTSPACATAEQNFINAGQNAANGAVANLVNIVSQLHAAGAKYILIANMPNLGNLPLFTDHRNFLYPYRSLVSPLSSASSALLNQGLTQQLNALPFDVIQADIYSIMNYMMANPSQFGFTNVTDALCSDLDFDGFCVDTTHLKPVDPNTYLFFDSIHPTAKGHLLIADYMYSLLQGPTYAALLAQMPFGNFQAQYANILSELQLLTIENAVPIKTWRIFASGNYSPQSGSAISDNKLPSYNANTKNATVGAYYRHNEYLTYGAAFGPSLSTISADNYSAKINEYFFSLFGDFRHNIEAHSIYINSILSFGLPTYSGIQRKINIGPANFVSNPASTRGQHFGGVVNAGLNGKVHEKLTIGPTVSLEYQSLSVNGYNETGLLPGANLNYFTQTNNSLVSSVGFQGTFLHKLETTQLALNGYIQLNNQYASGNRDMRFETASLPGSHGAVPVGAPTGAYKTIGASITSFFKNKVALTLSAKSLFGNSDFAQQIYTITASIPF